ncbi:MAG: hypothetical protein A3F94_01380 [Candidatus Spechtbacteria bacterium RIFCSPLOWO2_12_FULL_38_22]|uniref:Ribonuclease n=1 Tax=Candidatus Spechtbacteria bacterium RIFCSPLOWO2_12_FULL_38_22 TaxID=1802165 RepID=A0A1G2HG53_9BACT|nr:MAG: hypothetical protein A3E58_02685 [Candidatus Spechtbacteria bacterium RIFCSPHIGHO2_12_FULL_38_30]OGZ60519.1 MAG: hypothetical protein A3A00_02650 [Candidatus Spechtbacteria bacterium RIFCSPLOWO2_01_FULL_38_20]OGZ61485.1 MAG: hypothetical protein A3F94_01380 [Candidatus Spechtbacteria bacterium RIFCSPLOWO2_12_FULL_38_22]
MDFNYEKKLKRKYGYEHIVGLDEVGRGPLAGPVTVAAFMFYSNPTIGLPGNPIVGLRDSKLLSAKQREKLYEMFCDMKNKGLVDFATASVFPVNIDKKQIHHATVLAMRRAVKKLFADKRIKPDFAIVDRFPYKQKIFENLAHERIRGADNLVPSVAAASVVAKVKRDRSMSKYYHKKYPQYRFDLHKGYGTELHYKMLAKYGQSPIHRKSFRLS